MSDWFEVSFFNIIFIFTARLGLSRHYRAQETPQPREARHLRSSGPPQPRTPRTSRTRWRSLRRRFRCTWWRRMGQKLRCPRCPELGLQCSRPTQLKMWFSFRPACTILVSRSEVYLAIYDFNLIFIWILLSVDICCNKRNYEFVTNIDFII